jgi:hypothetical protein
MQCSISECKMKATQSIKIGFKEKRNLCDYHFKIYNNREQKYEPSFTRATKFK